jgi:hypothetical protein
MSEGVAQLKHEVACLHSPVVSALTRDGRVPSDRSLPLARLQVWCRGTSSSSRR